VQHDLAASYPDNPSAVGGTQTHGPMADATRLGRHLSDLARSGRDTPRPFALRRAAAVTSFATDHDDDFARAGLAADRRASLLVRAARLEDAVAWEAWDEVRTIVAGMTFHLAPYLFPAPALFEPPPTKIPPLRTVRVLWRLGRHRTEDKKAEDGERTRSAKRPRAPHGQNLARNRSAATT
jgi:hypothetical protein